MTNLIHNGNRTNSHSTKFTFDAADEKLVFQASVVREYSVVVMHVMRGTTVLDPDSTNFSNGGIDRCLEGVCETTEYSAVRLTVDRFSITAEVAPSATSTTASPSATSGFLITISMLGVIFLGNSFVTFRFDMASKAAMIAPNVESSATSCVCLYDVWVGDTQVGGKAGEIQASRFFADAALEIAD